MSRDTLRNIAKDVNWLSVLKALGVMLLPVILAAGFDFKTPSAQFTEQNNKIDAVAARIDTVEHRVEHSDKNLEVVLKLSCIDPRYTPRDRALVGLRCDSLMATQAGTVR